MTIQNGNGRAERVSVAYVSKATVHLVAAMADDSFRSLSARAGLKCYPYMEKSPVPIRLETSSYALTGFMHMASYEKITVKLAQKPVFLPLTDAEVFDLVNNTRWKVPFVAVNRKQIVFLQEIVSGEE